MPPASSTRTSPITGAEDVAQRLRAFAPKLAKRAMKPAMLAGASIVGTEAQRIAPQPPARSERGYKRTGDLAKSIVWKMGKVLNDSSGKPVAFNAHVLIDSKLRGKRDRNVRTYAHFSEFGVRPHAIGTGSHLEAWKGSRLGGLQVGAMHPGAEPHPFMRPAFDTKGDEATKAIVERIIKEVDKVSRELASGRQSP